jgi:tRNA threonylcarbamoyl adenosine modification protein YeaZ
MHVLLAIDSSLRTPSAIVRTGRDEHPLATGDRAVEELSRLIRDALGEAGVRIGDVDDVAVGVGPGSYMGARAAVASANALGFALDVPITSVVSSDAAAVLVADLGAFTVAAPAGRGRAFVARYRRDGDGRLLREQLPELVDDGGPRDVEGVPTVVAVDPGTASQRQEPEAGGLAVALSALGVARTFDVEPQLAVAWRAARAETILPPPTIGRPA